MRSDEKPFINLTMSTKVRYLLSTTPFCNKVSLVHTTKILSHDFYGKKSNLLDTPPRSNQSALICLPNMLSNFTLNLMNLSRHQIFYVLGTRIQT